MAHFGRVAGVGTCAGGAGDLAHVLEAKRLVQHHVLEMLTDGMHRLLLLVQVLDIHEPPEPMVLQSRIVLREDQFELLYEVEPILFMKLDAVFLP